MREISEILKEIRPSKGTQTAVADKLKAAGLKITSQQLGKYESGEYGPKADFFDKWEEVFGEDLRAIQKGNVQRNVSRGTEKPTSVQKTDDYKGTDGEVYRKIVEGNTEYVLIPRDVMKDVKLMSIVQIENEKRIMDILLDQNQKLIAKLLNAELPGVKATQKKA